MKRKIWRDAIPGAHHAPAKWPIAVATLFSVAFLSAFCQPVGAQVDSSGQDLAEAGLWLDNPTPSPQAVPFTGTYNLNAVMGAERFYNAGYTGTNAVMANIEAGYIWNGHESLSHVTYIPTNGAAGEVDRHATFVGSVLGGRTAGANPGNYQRGMAPDAQLASGAIATSWYFPSSSTVSFSFYADFYGNSTYGPYRAAFINGVPTNSGSRRADVVNSSWTGPSGSNENAGSDNLSGTLDAIACENPRTLLVWAAGNSSLPQVPTAASAYNNLTVAGLIANGGAFNIQASFSNRGPNDYYDPVTGTVPTIRQAVDIAAPALDFGVAYYGGKTGGNPLGSFDPAGGPNYYSRNIDGTSFAAPTVAGGAALLYDAAYAVLGGTPDARDSRVMKAVLMNSAAKTLGWDNGQTANPNGLGGVVTTSGLDNLVGAGRMDLNRAYDQLLSGTTDVAGLAQGALGTVAPIGWDFGQVGQGITNDYLIAGQLTAGSNFSATLTWFRDRQTYGIATYTEASFDNLDLELWSSLGGVAQNLISTSNSRYNNTEHFNFAIPTTGEYMLRVRWTEEVFDLIGDANIEQYGLAWADIMVPEPTALVLALLAAAMCGTTRRRP